MNESITHNRNRLVVKVLWFCLLLGITAVIAIGQSPQVIYTVAIAGFILITIPAVLVWKKRFIRQTVYVITVCLNLLTFIIIESDHTIGSFMMIFFALAVVTLYNNRFPILLSGFLGIGMSIYFFIQYSDTIFHGQFISTIAIVDLIFFLVTLTLYFQAKIGSQLQMDTELKQNEALVSKQEMEKVIIQVKAVLDEMKSFQIGLEHNMESTSRVSQELSIAFGEIAKGVEQQAVSVNEIGEAIGSMGLKIESVTSSADLMSKLSEEASGITRQGNDQITKLSNEMGRVGKSHEVTVSVIEELQQQMSEISGITEVIGGLARQTNLLSLNAAIEASRAGDAGLGFAVVAREVRKLSEESAGAVNQINQIVEALQHKVTQTSQEVEKSSSAIEASTSAVQIVTEMFSQIDDRTHQVFERADDVDRDMVVLQTSSRNVLEEATSVSGITEQHSASIEEVTASIEDQEQRVVQLTVSMKQLEQLMTRLQGLVSEQK